MKRLTVLVILVLTGWLGAACGGSGSPAEPAAVNENTAAAVTAVTNPTAPPQPTATTETTAVPTDEPTAEPTPEPTATETAVAASGPEEPVKIMLLDTLQLDDGQERLAWAKLAVEDFNAAAGWQVELVEKDTGLDAAAIVNTIDSAAGDGAIYAVIGPQRVVQILPAAAIFSAYGLPFITFNGYPALTEQGEQVLFRMVPPDNRQGLAAADFIANTLGAKNVYVIVQQGQGSPGSYGYELYTAFEQALNAAGGAIIARESVAPETAAFNSLAAAIKSSGADAVFGADLTAEQGALIAQAMREAGLDTPLIGHTGWAYAPFTAAEGAYVLSPAPAVTDEALAQRYTEQYGPFGADGPLTYAATMVILEAIQRAAEAGQLAAYNAVRDEIANTNQTNNILDMPIAFGPDGSLEEAQFYILQVENGAFKTVAP